MAEQTFVVVGGGLAGASAVTTLRGEGFKGELVLLAGEPEVPYIRPPLSKEYLMGQAERSAAQVHPENWYGDHGVDLRLGTPVESIDVVEKQAVLTGGGRLAWDKLLMATGSSARRLGGESFPEIEGVHYLRTLADSDALKDALTGGGRRVVVVGSGWIGLEVAAAARSHGNAVTVLGMEEVPLQLALGRELGTYFRDLHVRNGVDLRMQVRTAGLEHDDGNVTGVRLGDGTVVPADVVVMGVGAIPNTKLAEDAGLDVENGVKVDASLHAGHGVYAAGDVANAFHPVLSRHLRVEHWANAQWQGEAAARAMLGRDVSYDRVPYFYTDQFDLGMEFSGYGPLMAEARVVHRGDPESGEFISFWVTGPDRAARVVAGMNVNIWDVNATIDSLIASGRGVDVARLSDTAVELTDI
ncbi:MAG TPA: FAD-dependent oxidoreductase [Actinomycetaceae bacterium]|nr:FAD-dependent oxidoreductase [Actinomycetaceae bacterium]